MFKFNFEDPAAVEEEDNNDHDRIKDKDDKEVLIAVLPAGDPDKCKEHEICPDNAGDSSNGVYIKFDDDLQLSYVNSAETVEKIKTSNQVHLSYLEGNTDLVKNVYEGGFKIWECSQDLVQYLHEHQDSIEGQNVLELGCGAALPSCYCLRKKAKSITVQDFNQEVIDFITMPNCLSNRIDAGSNAVKLRLFSGDWADFHAKIKGQKFDLILTSETIYDVANYPKLLDVFNTLLSDDGRILLAAKIHYFGVGGGIRTFEQSLDQAGLWTYKTVCSISDGVKREIIEILRCK